MCSRVWGMGPSVADTTKIAPSIWAAPVTARGQNKEQGGVLQAPGRCKPSGCGPAGARHAAGPDRIGSVDTRKPDGQAQVQEDGRVCCAAALSLCAVQPCSLMFFT